MTDRTALVAMVEARVKESEEAHRARIQVALGDALKLFVHEAAHIKRIGKGNDVAIRTMCTGESNAEIVRALREQYGLNAKVIPDEDVDVDIIIENVREWLDGKSVI